MKYVETYKLRNGEECLLRNALQEDGAGLLKTIRRTHGETDFL